MMANNNNSTQKQEYRTRINYYIKVPQVKVVDEAGEFLGTMATADALKMAREQNLDLVEINPRVSPPIVKIVAYGKWKYEEKKKLAQIKKSSKVSQVKELSFFLKIESNDLDHKMKLAERFLSEGDQVRITAKFRGREVTHPEIGKEKLGIVYDRLSPLTSKVSDILLEGKDMSIVFYPKS